MKLQGLRWARRCRGSPPRSAGLFPIFCGFLLACSGPASGGGGETCAPGQGNCAAAVDIEMVSCEQFMKMRVLEEVRALGAGRVPQVCRDRKTEHQRRQSRSRGMAKTPYSTLERQLMEDGEYRRFHRKLGTLRDVLVAWPFAELVEPAGHREAIERLDGQNARDLSRAAELRRAELPFVLHGIKDIDAAVLGWTHKELTRLMGDKLLSVTVAGEYLPTRSLVATPARQPPSDDHGPSCTAHSLPGRLMMVPTTCREAPIIHVLRHEGFDTELGARAQLLGSD